MTRDLERRISSNVSSDKHIPFDSGSRVSTVSTTVLDDFLVEENVAQAEVAEGKAVGEPVESGEVTVFFIESPSE